MFLEHPIKQCTCHKTARSLVENKTTYSSKGAPH